eukprot:CAMPEP_0197841674 /NCGR_PEP_ID=MMETSP1437-20131217/46314_1 /TAXON_ID=49252 ORGANISM="Eucampia antarctica, Strain CCMP1452" /NCGR_SAMPLE_ID=MMETSP1437 /ASSEMBLY_ACC=CAM_ASM_001096 /LENGTH=155 /DNA_ID=CAMNT_0043451465 /DNA_START=832 /DNA_END=1299 /DNA_ORIENTATION=-
MRQHFQELEMTSFGVAPTPNQSMKSPVSVANNYEAIRQPLEMMAANSASTQDVLTKLTEIHMKSTESTTKSIKRVPPQFQNMILFALSQGTVVPSKINEEAVRLFSSPDLIQAQLFINSKLEVEGVECNISSALTTVFSYGNLLCAFPITPSGQN